MKKSIVFLVLLLSLFTLSGCAVNTSNPFDDLPLERDISSSDITWLTASQGGSSVTLNFTANSKIKDITIQVTFLDKNDSVVTTNTKSISSLVSGETYSLKFGIDFFEMLSVTKYTYKILSGTVDLT
ncbi:MAG: hypothetical protein RBQ91_02300 [Acholeplasma sp.]|nr:hypothetical protein [Acholeplasma sp.]